LRHARDAEGRERHGDRPGKGQKFRPIPDAEAAMHFGYFPSISQMSEFESLLV
jgi:hypothetical protein